MSPILLPVLVCYLHSVQFILNFFLPLPMPDLFWLGSSLPISSLGQLIDTPPIHLVDIPKIHLFSPPDSAPFNIPDFHPIGVPYSFPSYK